ncbi:uncharacterized protein LOC118348973 isoform X1 [Juglans regia]|uniref:Uncharacterized protein LOC109000338 isoform X1 n=1 Tax=Juglans regia TaxID=51240 RepID=A0A6P9EGV9_JUGRE|nr:uncharacterized protein LOC109000338 isoform X1 [Juglans regia]XP_035547515.1 uncharacterized protein LOC118348973 isoform X1 [Juglans regia]
MEIESAKCECCGLKEDCTQDYITEVKAKFDGKWLCGLCSEAVRDEVSRGKKPFGMEEAVKAHMSFCGKFKSNPAVRVADGMRQMLRRRSGDSSSSPSSGDHIISNGGCISVSLVLELYWYVLFSPFFSNLPTYNHTGMGKK